MQINTILLQYASTPPNKKNATNGNPMATATKGKMNPIHTHA
jgi:hypothetical protein